MTAPPHRLLSLSSTSLPLLPCLRPTPGMSQTPPTDVNGAQGRVMPRAQDLEEPLISPLEA